MVDVHARSRTVCRSVGARIRELRIAGALSQEDVAEKLSWSPRVYRRYEMGEKNATIDTLVRIADALDVEVAVFFETSTKPRARPGRPRKR